MMKITTAGHYELIRDNVLNNQSEFSLKQAQISTGKRYISRSEDTVAAAEAADIKRRDSDTEQFLTNTENALSWQIATASKVEEGVNLIQDALEETVSAQNGTMPPEQRKNISTSINTIIEQLLQVSESKFGEAYLFSGTDTAEAPFTAVRDPITNQITGITSNTDANTELRKTQLDPNTTVDYGALAGGADGIFESTTSGVNLFTTLINLRDQLATGALPIDADHKALEAGLDHSIGKLTASGVKQQWVDSHADSLINTRQMHMRQLSLLEDIDVAEAMMELSQLQATFQASLQIAVQAEQNSIMNYI